jgi:hypothetical protein
MRSRASTCGSGSPASPTGSTKPQTPPPLQVACVQPSLRCTAFVFGDGDVTEAIVDALEIVDVDDCQHELQAFGRELPARPIERAAVRHAAERSSEASCRLELALERGDP